MPINIDWLSWVKSEEYLFEAVKAMKNAYFLYVI